MYVTLNQIALFAPLVDAVRAQKGVHYVDENGMKVTGTLRGFTTEPYEDTRLGNLANLAESWVRITSVQGFELWIETMTLVSLLNEDAARIF